MISVFNLLNSLRCSLLGGPPAEASSPSATIPRSVSMVLEERRTILYICRMAKSTKRTKTASHRQDQFFKRLARPRSLLDLFDVIPGVSMYIKDTESRWVRSNRSVCEVVGVAHPDDLIGRTDFDFFPPALAAQYVAEDQRVIISGESSLDQVWMIPGKNGLPRIFLCSKIPLYDRSNKVIGLAGLNRPYEFSADESSGYRSTHERA